MKLSYNWLKDYIKCDLSAQQIADAMTSIGIEVDSVEETEVIEGGHRCRQVHGTSCLRRIVAVAGIVEKTHPCAQQSAGHQAQAGQGCPVVVPASVPCDVPPIGLCVARRILGIGKT